MTNSKGNMKPGTALSILGTPLGGLNRQLMLSHNMLHVKNFSKTPQAEPTRQNPSHPVAGE
jgi:hypothetical protein